MNTVKLFLTPKTHYVLNGNKQLRKQLTEIYCPMIEVNPSRFKMTPWKHQLVGVKTLIKKDTYGLWWKMRLGKSKVIIDTACLLFEAGVIDTVLIVAPAQVKDVWIERNLGEIKTHDWSGAKVKEWKNYGYSTEFNRVDLGVGPCYVVSSIEFIRQQGIKGNFPYVDSLLACLSGRRVWFVFDEASVLGNYKTANTKAMIALRNGEPIKKVTLLDGTPRGNSIMSLYSKFKVLDPTILDCKFARNFQVRYCKMGGYQCKQVVGERNTEDFAKRTRPHCEYLEQDALDMPEKVPGILTAALSDKAWKAYCSMRDELVAEIDQGICAVGQAAVKSMRLAQLCAGFLGGVTEYTQMDMEEGKWSGPTTGEPITVEVHDATAKMLMGWLEQRFAERPDFKCVVWSRFVPEIKRLFCLVVDKWECGLLYGEQKQGFEKLHPKHAYQGGFVGIAQPQSAQYGYNFSKADTVVYLSQDYNRITRAQSEDRVQATGARKSTSLLDVLVTGPRGQKTIVHDIIQSVREKEDAERRTAKDWIKALREE